MSTTALICASPVPRRTAVLLAAVIAISWLAGCERAKLDREVDRLCAIDGGVKVFETVEVPPEYLPDAGEIFPQFADRPFGERLGPEYELKWADTVLVDGNPSLTRTEAHLIRKSDQKILGTSIRYMRLGGDLPSPSHPSSHVCPELGGKGLERSVFVERGVKK
jgi:hypothetical protein